MTKKVLASASSAETTQTEPGTDAKTHSTKKARSPEDREASSVQILLAVFLLFAALWAVTIPLPATRLDPPTWDGFNPDEQFHMKYIAYIAMHFKLPVPWIGTSANGSDLYTALHPPLYYTLGAIFYAIVAPLFGYGAAIYTLRFIGALIGAGTVYLTYRVARKLLPHDISLFAAAVVAGVPMFVSLSGSATNEVAASLAASGTLLMLISGLIEGFDRRRAVLTGLWIAASLSIKVTDVALILPALAAIALAPATPHSGSGEISKRAIGRTTNSAVTLLIPAAAIGWWFIRNILLFGDPLQARVHYDYWSKTVQKPWWTLMSSRQFFWNSSFVGWESFWGIFDAFARPMPDNAYFAAMALQIPAAIGFIYYMIRTAARDRVLRNAACVLALFSAIVIAIFFATNWRIYSPQGRYLFPLMTPFGIATSVGWTAFWVPRWRPFIIAAAMLLLLALNVFALVIMPVRPLPH